MRSRTFFRAKGSSSLTIYTSSLCIQPYFLHHLGMPLTPRLQHSTEPGRRVDKPLLGLHHRLDFYVIRVNWALDVECPQCSRHIDEKRILREMHARADPAPGAVGVMVALRSVGQVDALSRCVRVIKVAARIEDVRVSPSIRVEMYGPSRFSVSFAPRLSDCSIAGLSRDGSSAWEIESYCFSLTTNSRQQHFPLE